MSNSLRDQLIKAGVVTQEQADKAAAEQRKTRRSGGGGKAGSDDAGGRRQRSGGGKGGAGKGAAGAGQEHRGASGRRRSGNRRGRGPQDRGSQGAGRGAQDDSPEAVRARAAAQQRGRDQRAVKALRAALGGSEKAQRDELRRFIAQYDQRSREAADTDEPYNFVHNRKIKRIHIPVAQIEALSTGQLVIVNNDGRYALLPLGPAFTIAEVDRRRIVAAHVNAADESDDFGAAAVPTASNDSAGDEPHPQRPPVDEPGPEPPEPDDPRPARTPVDEPGPEPAPVSEPEPDPEPTGDPDPEPESSVAERRDSTTGRNPDLASATPGSDPAAG